MNVWTRIATAALCVFVAISVVPRPSAFGADPLPDGGPCVIDAGAGGLAGARGVIIHGKCVKAAAGGPAAQPGPPTKIVFCGRPSSKENTLWSPECGAPRACYDDVADPKHQHPEDAFATFVLSGKTWVLQSVWCPTSSTPIPDTQALREQALRLLPTVAIGSAWTHRALIHAQTILWADTPTERSLPTVTVVGQPVDLRIHFEHADWDYGDTTTATSTSPGRPYDHNDPCSTAQCPGYHGHTYTHTGPATITLTVAWHAQFSLDHGSTWTDIGTTALTGPTATRQLDLLQARGVLVRTPGT